MLFNPFDDQPHNVRKKVTFTYFVLVITNLAAWAWAWIAFSNEPLLLGTAFLAYIFGVRHAFDPDHIMNPGILGVT